MRAQKRARLVLAAGVSLTASALVHIAWASAAQRPCGGREERRGLHTNSLIAAGVVGGVGISLTFVGGFRLAASKPLIQDPGATRHRAAIVGLSIGAFAATQLLLGIVRFAQLGFCAS